MSFAVRALLGLGCLCVAAACFVLKLAEKYAPHVVILLLVSCTPHKPLNDLHPQPVKPFFVVGYAQCEHGRGVGWVRLDRVDDYYVRFHEDVHLEQIARYGCEQWVKKLAGEQGFREAMEKEAHEKALRMLAAKLRWDAFMAGKQ